MIITRTPYRAAFLGGGTDLPAWYERHGGAFMSCCMNHYSWVTCRYLPPFFEHRHRVVWSKLERPDYIEDIQHPAVRAALQEYGFGDKGVDVTVLSDLPARSGLGSSSTFAVGLIKALMALQGKSIGKKELARQAIHLERTLLQEAGGIQDQIAAAYGGFNYGEIAPDGSYTVLPLDLEAEREKEFSSHLLLFFTGFSRTAAGIEVEKAKVMMSGAKDKDLKRLQELPREAKDLLMSGGDIADFGAMVDETWNLKRGLVSGIASDYVDDIYKTAKAKGALGAKLLGAGGGGFFVVFARPENHAKIRSAFSKMIHVPFEIEHQGSHLVLNRPQFYDEETYKRRDFIHLNETEQTEEKVA